MSVYKLYFFLIGCTPAGRNTEQHDIFFTIAKSLSETVDDLKAFWPEAKGKIHIDGWREVTNVDGYEISIVDRPPVEVIGKKLSLFFLNLGGYKENEFEEFHYKLLTIADNKTDAINHSKQTAFYKHTGYKGASSHIDEKYGVDADDIHEVSDILPEHIRKGFSIRIKKTKDQYTDIFNMGYLTLNKMMK